MVYLDNSATSFPKPESVYKSINKAMKYYYSNPGRGGYKNALDTAQKVYETREKLANMFHCPQAENVVFTPNCTMALNIVIHGVIGSGVHVLISDLEHNSVARPLERLRRESKIEYDCFKTDFYSVSETLSNLQACMRANTRFIICTHASNVLGAALPIREIGEFCHENNLVFIVDAAQSAGILPIDMCRDYINYLCISAHKGLYSPMGCGVLCINGDIPQALTQGGTGSRSLDLEQPGFLPDCLESGTLNVSGILGLSAGLDFVRQVGCPAIHEKEKSCVLKVYHKLKQEPNIRFYCDYDRLREFSNAVSFTMQGKCSEEVAKLLAHKGIAVRGGYHCSPLVHRKIATLSGGTVRISPSFFTTNEEINYAIETIKKLT